jgi:pimeloyl-ACP methyl ester carboxylesterase
MSVQTGYAAAPGGAQLYYEVAGLAHTYALVFVHAGVSDLRLWDDQFSLFAENYRVLRFDARGYGKSAPVAGEYAPHEDITAVMTHTGIERACLVGCSRGGAASMDFALIHPARATGLVMVCSEPRGFEMTGDEPAEWRAVVAAFNAGDMETANEHSANLWLDGPGRPPKTVNAALRAKFLDMNLIPMRHEKHMEASGTASTETGLKPFAVTRMGEIACPVLAIVGEYDHPSTMDAARLMARECKAQVVTLPSGHLPSMEVPGLFNDALSRFLDGLQPTPSL